MPIGSADGELSSLLNVKAISPNVIHRKMPLMKESVIENNCTEGNLIK